MAEVSVGDRPKGVSIINYCKMNGVVHGRFERWYKRCVADVKIVNLDAAVWGEPSSGVVPDPEVRMSVRIDLQDGLSIEYRNLDMAGLKTLVSKLEAICWRLGCTT